ncbi:MAG: SDR family oxidoreductase [Bacteroidota bacterium]
MILITGATGNLGKTTLDFLLKKVPAFSLAAMARQPEKLAGVKALGVDVRQGDYKDPASMLNAFKGIDTLFLVSSSDLTDRSTQHINAIDAAKQAGVKHIVFTSFQRKTDTGSPIQFLAQSYIDSEKHLKSSGMTYTILKNGLYAEVLPMFLGQTVLETGIFFPAGATKSAYTSRKDMAEAAAAVLAGTGHENKEYELATEENVSFTDIASLLSELSGKTVGYVDPVKEIFIDALTKAGVPEQMIGMAAGFAEAIKLGEFASGKTDLQRLLGHPPVTMRESLQTLFFKQ